MTSQLVSSRTPSLAGLLSARVGPGPTPNAGPRISGFGGVGPSVVGPSVFDHGLGVGPCLGRVGPSFSGFGVRAIQPFQVENLERPFQPQRGRKG